MGQLLPGPHPAGMASECHTMDTTESSDRKSRKHQRPADSGDDNPAKFALVSNSDGNEADTTDKSPSAPPASAAITPAETTTLPVTPAPDAPPPLTYAQTTKQTAPLTSTTFTGKNTITADVSSIDKFNEISFLQDLKRLHPVALKTLRGCGLRGAGRRTLELMFATPQDRDRLLLTGLNTHSTHLTFTPDVPAPTSVTLFNLPMELPDHVVDAAMTKYGTVTTRYRHKRNFDGLTLLTGLRVYKMNITTSIPKHITIAGHSIKTLYTGQEEALLAKRQQQQQQGATTATADRLEMDTLKKQMHEVLPRGSTETRQSFLHPERPTPPKGQCETKVVELHDRILIAEKHHKVAIIEGTLETDLEVEDYTDPDTALLMEKRPLDVPALIAIVTSSSYHHLPRSRFTGHYSFNNLTALSYYLQFGYASTVDLDRLNYDVWMEEAVNEWVNYDDFDKETIINFGNDFVDRFKGYLLVLPKDSS